MVKTRDQVVDVTKRWMAEIGDLREKYPLRVVMRDNAGENKSKALQEYFTSMRTTTQQRMNHGRMAWLKQQLNQLL
jgi:hypothetical protein